MIIQKVFILSVFVLIFFEWNEDISPEEERKH
jgi:hypothetical protein